MKIRLLGPVQVESAGRTLDVGPRQRRVVLAALAIDAGTPVSLDTLTQRVWGPDVPAASRSALYAHLTRLRHALSASGEEGQLGLRRQGNGYVLHVDRQQVDLHRLETLMEAGRAEETERITLLRKAMELWRGQPLSTLTGDWVTRVRRGAESQLIGVAVAWATEELRLGHAEAVAGRLPQILGAYPLAEPLVALHMRALCALGRASEALQGFAQVRARLAEQLGVEPGPQLRELHLAMLRGELEHPGPESVAASAVLTVVPQQLPADVMRLPVHQRELRRITESLVRSGDRGGAPLAGLYGAAGAGKSTLAIHAARRLKDQYPDGQLYLDLRGNSAVAAPLCPGEALRRLLRALGACTPLQAQADELAALFRSLVSGRKLLLVLDNAGRASQVRPLLPSGSGCATLVTSRQPLAGLGDLHQVRVGGLTPANAVMMLGHWVGTERTAAEPEAAAGIAHWCEYLPLALRIAAARLTARPDWPLAELRDRLADEGRRLDNLELDGVGLRASIAGSYRRLSDSSDFHERATAEAFKVLGAAGEAVLSRSAAARLLTRSEVDAERVLECLVDAQLLETSAPGTYRMGDLTRLYARERHAELQGV